ncbi:MAG TPA: PEGA domain-containing protein [Stellaceae bacterium]|nr:PEGA domain-containing protein [Stellaceae bacterium]
MATERSKRATRGKGTKAEAVMSIEYLLVVFPEDRTVLADGDSVGVTNHVLMLPANEYEITLSGQGYTPDSQDVILAGTSVMRPRVVTFDKA